RGTRDGAAPLVRHHPAGARSGGDGCGRQDVPDGRPRAVSDPAAGNHAHGTAAEPRPQLAGVSRGAQHRGSGGPRAPERPVRGSYAATTASMKRSTLPAHRTRPVHRAALTLLIAGAALGCATNGSPSEPAVPPDTTLTDEAFLDDLQRRTFDF